jgi:hypothetical protein
MRRPDSYSPATVAGLRRVFGLQSLIQLTAADKQTDDTQINAHSYGRFTLTWLAGRAGPSISREFGVAVESVPGQRRFTARAAATVSSYRKPRAWRVYAGLQLEPPDTILVTVVVGDRAFIASVRRKTSIGKIPACEPIWPKPRASKRTWTTIALLRRARSKGALLRRLDPEGAKPCRSPGRDYGAEYPFALKFPQNC